MSTPLTVALAKGRLQEPALARFGRAGIAVHPEEATSRRLWLDARGGGVRFVLVKPADVPTYVEYGIADAGVCGSDLLDESGADVHAPLDLGFGRCRLVVAAPFVDGAPRHLPHHPRVATKYPRTAARYFHGRGQPVTVVALSGSVELAVVTGLADRIVDLVETGRTLADNGLGVEQVVAEVSARLVVNRAAWQLRRGDVLRLVDALGRAAGGEG